MGCSLQDFDSLGAGAGQLLGGGAAGVAGSTDTGATGGVAGASGGSGGSGGLGSGGFGGGAGGRGGSQSEGGVNPGGGTGGLPPPAGSGGTTSVGDGGVGEPVNLIADPGFESGHVDWVGFGNSHISDVTDRAHTGAHCIGSIDRVASWEGPARRIESLVAAGAQYDVSVWAWTAAATPTLSLSLKQVCSGETDTYTPLATQSLASTWVHLQGRFTVPSCTLSELRIYAEGPAAGEDFYVDDVSLSLAP